MPRLSICSIFGNESVHIERFLRSFAKIADEFVLVRAIGAAEPDGTRLIASVICKDLGIPLVLGEYRNAMDERKDWKHVDDFGAARQESFNLAKGDWKGWFDLDDVWPENNPNNDELIRRLKAGELEEYNRLHISYHVPDAGAMVARERFAKSSANPKWVNPIHEELHVPGRWLYVEQCSVLHAPLVSKTPSAERNLRILEFATNRPDLYSDQATLWFYKHRELMFLGRVEESVAAADKALSLLNPLCAESSGDPQDTHTVLLYEILTTTASICLLKGDASGARVRCHGAINVMPGRREAYAVLVQIEHRKGNNRKMLDYAATMRGIPEPVGINRPWTQRDALYSWHGAFLYHQALRINGQIQLAEEEEEKVFRMEGQAISIIHPTMCRADVALQTYEKWMSSAINPGSVQYIFAIDAHDDYAKKLLAPYKTVICPRGAHAAAEHARKFATGKRIEVIADGWEPVPGWDQDFSKVKKPSLPWKLEAPYAGYPNVTLYAFPRYIICGKEAISPHKDFQPQHCHFELGWEQGTSHVYAKMLLSQGKLTRDDVIVTLPGREFLYETCFDRVIMWEQFCKETERTFGTPYRDASGEHTLDLVEYFERNWHRYDGVYFSGPGQTWSGGAWDLIQSFKKAEPAPHTWKWEGDKNRWLGHQFLLVSLRKRPHESRRDTPDVFGKEVLRNLRDTFRAPIFLVGLNLPDFGVEGVQGCSLQDFATLAQDPLCVGILGPHSGPNGLAGLLAPKGKNIIIFPMEYCPSINSNYPSGMGKCLNLNGNIRHWMPVQSSPADIAAKAKEVFLP